MTARKKVDQMAPGRRKAVHWNQLTLAQRVDVRSRMSAPYQSLSTGRGKRRMYIYYIGPDNRVDRRHLA